ncbi:hypothetical protein [Methylomagnum ishizawai]|uniref:hypothetical protein n=1 Tax=Methylomagnum ishizawai TaxID=1760988 RepID=UPI000A14ACA9|nr:hypothetical protein [Methylomagnum ishizawai]
MVFRDHLRYPFLKAEKAWAEAGKIAGYGQALFQQVFADPDAYAEYKRCLRVDGLDLLRFEIVGSPGFNTWHWEAVHDLALPRPIEQRA